MFCTNCGKEIPEEGACFCPNCGSNVGHSANEKMKTYTGKAVETAQDFVGDIKQVVKDKDTAGFLKRNKHRNLKIIIGIMVVLFLMPLLVRDVSLSQNPFMLSTTLSDSSLPTSPMH